MNDEMRLTKSFFESNSISLSDDWLESCINWFKQENPNSYTQKELQTQIYEQWLLLDFRDLNLPILPPNANTEKKRILTKSICLQIMSVVDISKPKHWQLQRIRNSNVLSHHSVEEVGNSKRVLQLLLTDGVQDIEAFEYKPIQALKLNLTPGIKVKINAPITIRRGQIMLEPGSIKVLGGEVEDILISNASENVLAAALGLPLNENPTVIQETFDNADKDILYKPIVNSFKQERNIYIKNENDRVGSVAQRMKTPDLFDDDFNTEDFEGIDKICETVQPKSYNSHVPVKNERNVQHFDDGFDSDEFAEMIKLENEVAQSPKRVLPSTAKIATNPVSNSQALISKSQITLNLDDILGDDLIGMIPDVKVKPPMPIGELLQLQVTKGKFVIQAKFKNVVQKLAVTEEGYSIKIIVEDDSGEIVVQLHSDVISNFMGYEAEAMMALKKGVQARDSQTSAIIFQAIDGFKEKLLSLDSKMEVLIEAGQDSPVVLKLL